MPDHKKWTLTKIAPNRRIIGIRFGTIKWQNITAEELKNTVD